METATDSEETAPEPKPLEFVGSSRKDMKAMPQQIQSKFGQALWKAQLGKTHIHAKALKGFHGTGVVEIIEDHDGNTYRAIYTVRFAGLVIVLDIFQKKSKSGIATPREYVDRLKGRIQLAEEVHAEWLDKQK